MTFGITGMAQANTTYSADFTLPDHLPAFDGPFRCQANGSAGDFHAIVNSRDLLSSTVNLQIAQRQLTMRCCRAS